MSTGRLSRRFALLALVALLGACAARPPAPVVDRSTVPRAEIPVDGLHRVNRGDTLHGIAFKYGLDWRDIARWNGIPSPYTIYPDQVVRLRPPPSTAGSRAGAGSTGPVVRAVPTPSARSRPASPPVEKPAPVPSAPSAPAPSAGGWAWPTEGRVLRTFKSGDPARNGLDIGGREGQPVRAAASGEVVYSGNGLIGYGELIIIKHDDRMLSAYAHNRERLVAEGDRVSQGARIAVMGRDGRDQALLHFEIRRDGKPVDPLSYLPKR